MSSHQKPVDISKQQEGSPIIQKTTSPMTYKRILLKLSGEALLGENEFGIDSKVLAMYAKEIKAAIQMNIEVAIVIGGGNIFRGVSGVEGGMKDRANADYMGMLATMINAMALQGALENEGLHTRLLSAIKMEQIAEPFIRRKATRHLQKGRVVIFGAGTGNPYFTTDTAATLRASEMNCEAILKGTKVDGVYDKDPAKHDDAIRYETVSYDEVLQKHLGVMDASAIALARDNDLPIIVFSLDEPGGFKGILAGEGTYTVVKD